MLIEDGRRLLISNLDLEPLTRNAGNSARDPEGLLSRESFEFFRLLAPKDEGANDPVRDRFEVGTAVRMSATFPYITPTVSLPTVPRRRVVDAGYFDNYGVSLAAAWLNANWDWVQKNASGVAMVQIRDSLSEADRTLQKVDGQPPPSLRREPSSVVSRGLEGFTSPPEGVLSVRGNSAVYRDDEQFQLLSRYFNNRQEVSLLNELTSEQTAELRKVLNVRTLTPHSSDVKGQRGTLRAAQSRQTSGPLFTPDQMAEVERVLDRKPDALFLTTVAFELGDEVSLTWYLTRQERQLIRAAAEGPATRARIGQLKQWWLQLPLDRPVGR
jgi:hypothetical protein